MSGQHTNLVTHCDEAGQRGETETAPVAATMQTEVCALSIHEEPSVGTLRRASSLKEADNAKILDSRGRKEERQSYRHSRNEQL